MWADGVSKLSTRARARVPRQCEMKRGYPPRHHWGLVSCWETRTLVVGKVHLADILAGSRAWLHLGLSWGPGRRRLCRFAPVVFGSCGWYERDSVELFVPAPQYGVVPSGCWEAEVEVAVADEEGDGLGISSLLLLSTARPSPPECLQRLVWASVQLPRININILCRPKATEKANFSHELCNSANQAQE